MLNNLGAERFAAGELEGALEAFRGALSYIPARTSEIDDPLRASVATEPSCLGIAFMSVDETPDKFAEDQPFVYHKPLVFNRLIPETQDGAAAFCGVVVFNMALAFDMRSKASYATNSANALHLYSSCIDLFSKTSRSVDLTAAMAAACNNKARMYYEENSYEDSNRELQRLQNYMILADSSPTKMEILEVDDFQGILLNLMLLWPPIVAQAA